MFIHHQFKTTWSIPSLVNESQILLSSIWQSLMNDQNQEKMGTSCGEGTLAGGQKKCNPSVTIHGFVHQRRWH